MSRESQLNAEKKESLVDKVIRGEEDAELRLKEIADLKAQLQASEDGAEKASVEKDVSESSASESVAELLEQNRRLREELDKRKDTNKFVFLECQSKGQVWLPAPESRTGMLADKEKGRMLKGDKDFAVIPAYWMLDFIAHEHPGLENGELVLNNDRGREINPDLEFIDYVLPSHFIDVSVKNVDIEKMAKKADNEIYDFIKKRKDKRPLLGRTKGVVDALIASEESKEESKRDETYIAFLTSVSLHIDETLNPNREEKNRDNKKREEVILKTV